MIWVLILLPHPGIFKISLLFTALRQVPSIGFVNHQWKQSLKYSETITYYLNFILHPCFCLAHWLLLVINLKREPCFTAQVNAIIFCSLVSLNTRIHRNPKNWPEGTGTHQNQPKHTKFIDFSLQSGNISWRKETEAYIMELYGFSLKES